MEIIFTSPSVSGTYRYSTSPDIEHGWGEPETVEELESGDLLAALTLPGGTVLLYARAGGRSVATLRRGDDSWITGRNLTLDGAEWTVPASGVVFATLGERIAGMWIPHDGVVRWGEWDVDGGEAVVGASPLRALSPNSGPAMTRQVATAVTYVVLVVTLVTVFVRRRRSVFTPATLKPEQRPAGFGRRVLAFAIDATLFIPGTTYAFAPMLREYGFDSQMLLQVAASDNEVMNELSLRWLAAVAAFVVYATTFELWWGATPGKRLMRCRVVTERGEPCSVGRVLVRNVLRGVEFYPYMILLWTLTLVVLTRNRQRLGDLIAGTVVVEEKPGAGSAD